MKKLWKQTKNPSPMKDDLASGIMALLGNGKDLSYACRLAFEEGPWHHSQANYILLNALLKGIQSLALEKGVDIRPYEGDVVEIPMHRPPHHRNLISSGVYPVDLPVNLLINLAGNDDEQVETMIEALSEGAPHHVMANIITLHLAEAIFSLIGGENTSGSPGEERS